jgi:hypothetical protein
MLTVGVLQYLHAQSCLEQCYHTYVFFPMHLHFALIFHRYAASFPPAQPLIEFAANSKSAQRFFFTADGRYDYITSLVTLSALHASTVCTMQLQFVAAYQEAFSAGTIAVCTR